MPVAWIPMCGQTWMAAAASFLGMWTVMMTAMMLPSLLPALWRYRRAVGRAGEWPTAALLTVIVAAGYCLVRALLGAAIFPLGAAAAAATMRYPALARAVPAATGLVVLAAGALQLTRWKAHHLACCRAEPRRESPGSGHASPADTLAAWRHGVRLGLHCSRCCAGATAALLVVGLMNGPAMLAAAVAVNLERLAPAAEQVARAIGVLVMGAGLFLTARAAGLW